MWTTEKTSVGRATQVRTSKKKIGESNAKDGLMRTRRGRVQSRLIFADVLNGRLFGSNQIRSDWTR